MVESTMSTPEMNRSRLKVWRGFAGGILLIMTLSFVMLSEENGNVLSEKLRGKSGEKERQVNATAAVREAEANACKKNCSEVAEPAVQEFFKNITNQTSATMLAIPLVVEEGSQADDILLAAPLFKYTLDDDISNRSVRFPSVEDRVRYYMAEWYAPPCTEEQQFLFKYDETTTDSTGDDSSRRLPTLLLSVLADNKDGTSMAAAAATTIRISAQVQVNTVFYLSHDDDTDALPNYGPNKLQTYREDTETGIWERLRLMNSTSDFVKVSSNTTKLTVPSTPVLLLFGDGGGNLGAFPIIRKSRTIVPLALAEDTTVHEQCHNQAPDLSFGRGNPVIWKLNTKRHYGALAEAARSDSPWHRKKNVAVWRGAFTGRSQLWKKNATDQENCQAIPRCRFVYEYHKSRLVDAGVTKVVHGLSSSIVNGEELKGKKMNYSKLLQYKALIMLEGNDVATGLKWALLCKSVVMMPAPKFSTWAMEDLLEPWVHYIPLKEDLSDVEEQVRWMRSNDDTARKISERGTLWMQDLVISTQAKEDERSIEGQILQRYTAHFRSKPIE